MAENPLLVDFEIFQKSCMTVHHVIDENKTQTIHKRITDSNGDQKKLFNIIKTLLGRQKKLVLPDYNDPITHLKCILSIRLQTFVQSFLCLRVHYLRTHLGRWIPLCLLVQIYFRGLL